MVGCACNIASGHVPAPKNCAPHRDLSPSGHGHYRSLFAASGRDLSPSGHGHYRSVYSHAPCAARPHSIRGSHPPSRRRLSRMMGDDTSASTAGFPAGSVFRYSATWPNTPILTAVVLAATPITPTVSPQQVYQAILSDLASRWGISLNSMAPNPGLVSSTLGFTVQGYTNSDYGSINDVKSILDGEINGAVGSMPSSSIVLVNQSAAAAAAGLLPAGTPFDLSSFLSDNWPLLAAIGIGAVVVHEVL